MESNVPRKLHALNAKKIDTPNLWGAKNSVARGSDNIYADSVADLLNDVKSEFRGTFSEDV